MYCILSPDRTTPFPETLKAIDELYKEGKLYVSSSVQCIEALNDSKIRSEYFGLSNYKCYEVGEIVTLCRVNNWIVPTVYEGLYSAIDRTLEVEYVAQIRFLASLVSFLPNNGLNRMIPCLRHFNIKLAAYSPLAGGFLVGHMLSEDAEEKGPEEGSHFDPETMFGAFFNGRYSPMRGAVSELNKVVVCLSFLHYIALLFKLPVLRRSMV